MSNRFRMLSLNPSVPQFCRFKLYSGNLRNPCSAVRWLVGFSKRASTFTPLKLRCSYVDNGHSKHSVKFCKLGYHCSRYWLPTKINKFLTYWIRKSEIFPWIEILSHPCYLTQKRKFSCEFSLHWLCRTSGNFVIRLTSLRRHNYVKFKNVLCQRHCVW